MLPGRLTGPVRSPGRLSGVDVTADTPMTAPGCMSFLPDVNECTDLFPNLGLTWDTGDCVDDCSAQIVFSGE